MKNLFKNLAFKLILLTVILILLSGISSAVSLRELSVEEVIEIKLYENPSTGYRWHLNESAAENLQLLKEEYEPLTSDSESEESEAESSRQLVGQGRIKSWTFRGLEAGYQLLTFELARSGGEVKKTLKYLVVVE
ncbi:putative secreted protein [Halanaerobium saccharolyticum]|uniref:Putative secreted protein n=1 Tax=Halanaerobium saccharolyticum TaxID=43595 RepID=A0A4R6RZW5_9FIRM|nr:protease inhibitor I42 family protein [Halanaerobium saccharolyticum]TDP92779.1 putative secreted protein [Halanaerobium saccharolyticum]